MASISFVQDHIKRDPLQFISPALIFEACQAHDYTDWRSRELDPAVTIGLFIQQVVHGNVSCAEVRHLAGKDFTASAYCQARGRIPLSVYQDLLERIYRA